MLDGVQYITVASDASVSTHRAANGSLRTGLAYYIRDDSGTTKRAWHVDTHMTSTEAEVLAMEGLTLELFKRPYEGRTKLIYYADCALVIQVLQNEFGKNLGKKKYKHWQTIVKRVSKRLEHITEVEPRYVKAHTSKQDEKKYYMNKWCDENARAMMRYGKMSLKELKRSKLYEGN